MEPAPWHVQVGAQDGAGWALADEVLGLAAVVRGRDTGFVRRLGEALRHYAAPQLVVNLAELAWRLAHARGPDIFTLVWNEIEAEFDVADLEQIDALVHMLAHLTYTQPERLFTLLTGVLPRLPALQEAALRSPAGAVPGVPAQEWSGGPSRCGPAPPGQVWSCHGRPDRCSAQSEDLPRSDRARRRAPLARRHGRRAQPGGAARRP